VSEGAFPVLALRNKTNERNSFGAVDETRIQSLQITSAQFWLYILASPVGLFYAQIWRQGNLRVRILNVILCRLFAACCDRPHPSIGTRRPSRSQSRQRCRRREIIIENQTRSYIPKPVTLSPISGVTNPSVYIGASDLESYHWSIKSGLYFGTSDLEVYDWVVLLPILLG
jgi:hypothetical protein